MSALSSVSSGTKLFQAAARRTGGAGRPDRAQFEQQRRADFASALQSAGVDASKVDDIQKQVDAAVQAARQNGTGGVVQRAAIRSAIDGVLQQNGVDTTKFQQALKALHAQHAHGARGRKGDGDGDADDGGSAPSVGESSESGQPTVNSQAGALLKALAEGSVQQSDLADLPVGSLVNVAA